MDEMERAVDGRDANGLLRIMASKDDRCLKSLDRQISDR